MTTSPDLDELRGVLQAHTAALPDNVDREHEVRDRVAAHRRRRLAVGTAGTVVLAAAATVLAVTWLPIGTDTDAPKPTPVVNTPQGDELPEYLRGGHLLAAKEGVSARGISVTFTPTSDQFGFALGCANPDLAHIRMDHAPMAMTSINGTDALGIGCGPGPLGSDGDADFGQMTTDWVHDYGVVIGQPTTVRFAFDKGTHPGTTFRIGVYQGVPVDEYPFPPAPATLEALSPGAMRHHGGRMVMDSGPHPSRPEGFSYTVRVYRGLAAMLQTVAPGALRMYANDTLVWSSRSWDYNVHSAEADLTLTELGIRPGQKVTLRFEADRFPPGSYWYRLYDYAQPTH